MSEPASEQSLFLHALGLPTPAGRAAYLDEACRGKPGLRAELDALLAAHDRLGGGLPLTTGHEPAGVPPGPGPVPGGGAGDVAGEVLSGRYKLVEQIGEGGMGTVWMAQQTAPVKRLVALKVIKPGMDSKQVLARFEAERQALALMDHPHIARVLDAGTTAAGRPYFVMELVKGVPITRYCDEHRLTPRQRLELFLPVCQALQHAHQKGVIHRDIKPSNVLVALYDGQPMPKVIDFGIAKAAGQPLTERTLVTGFGAVVGTLEYMSPEQAELNQLDIDTRSDVYSLGVLLYELLTGTTPLDKKRLKEAAMLEVLRLIREEEPPKPSTRLSTTDEMPSVAANRGLEPRKLSGLVRGELDWIVMKALEKDRNRRYETANGFALDVQRYLADEPVLACPPSAAYRFRKFARRHKALLTTTAAILVTLMAATGTVAWKWLETERAWQQEQIAKGEAEGARDEAKVSEQRAKNGELRAVQAERLGRLREADALVGQARGTRLSRRPGQRFEALEALGKAAAIGHELGQPPEWFDRPRNEAIAALALPDLHITKQFGKIPRAHAGVDLSTDFEWYVVSTEKGGCTIQRVADDTEVAQLPELGERVQAEFGAGRVLAVRGHTSGQFQLWDLSGEKPALRFKEAAMWSHGFHPKGRLIAVARRDGIISVHDVSTGARLHGLQAKDDLREVGLRFHPTGPFLATSSHFCPTVRVYDLRSGAVVASKVPPWQGPNGLAGWSPDGRTLTISTGEPTGEIQQYGFDPVGASLKPLRTIRGFGQGGTNIVYNPAGDLFARSGWGGEVHLFDAVSGQFLFSSLGTELMSGLRFDRTGQRLFTAPAGERGDRIGVLSIADGREYRHLMHHGVGVSGAYWRPAVHPNGRLMALALHDGLAFFDLATGQELAHVPIRRPHGRHVSFDGNGSLLTNGFEGCFRWPVRSDAAQPDVLIGPPERLPFHPGNRSAAASHDGRVIAQGMWAGYGMEAYAGGWILYPGAAPRQVAPRSSVHSCSVSPDGRWVAFSYGHAPFSVYDAATGRCVWQCPSGRGANGRFSPNGRWLVTDTDGGRLYEVGTWKPGPQLGPGTPLDVTSDLAVLGQPNGIYRLVELTTGRELARLEDPDQITGEAALTPDGTKLVVVDKNNLHVRVWDLRRIRAGLAKLRLDWEAPPYPPANAPAKAGLKVSVDQGDLGAEEHYLLGGELLRKGRLAEAAAEFREAIRLKKDHADAHYNLGNALLERNELDQAAAAFRTAIKCKPEFAEAHCNLGHVLRRKSEYRQALEELRRGHKLGEAMGERWRYPSKQWVQYCEHLVELEGRLPGFLERKSAPASPVERIELAQICSLKGLNHAAARFYEKGFDADPKLASTPGGVHRYNAACAAALAAGARGKDAGKLDDKERVRLRRQALEWLRADLEAWNHLLDKERDQPRSVAQVTKNMRLWLADVDLAGVRGPAALAKLPEAERGAWQKLWSDVAATLARTQGQATPKRESATKQTMPKNPCQVLLRDFALTPEGDARRSSATYYAAGLFPKKEKQHVVPFLPAKLDANLYPRPPPHTRCRAQTSHLPPAVGGPRRPRRAQRADGHQQPRQRQRLTAL